MDITAIDIRDGELRYDLLYGLRCQAMSRCSVIVPLLVAASAAFAQECPVTTDVATYPTQPATYPMTSDHYAVQYQVGGGSLTSAQVYVSYYGATTSSPYIKASTYP